jgi:hypothetical protein
MVEGEAAGKSRTNRNSTETTFSSHWKKAYFLFLP